MWGADKTKHMLISFGLVCSLMPLTNGSLKSAVIITALIGIVKEVSDLFSPNHNAELMDLVADGVGILGAVLFVLFVEFLIK